MPCQKKRGVRRFFFCPKMHYAPGWGGNGDKNSTPTELFWAGTKLGHPQKPQVFQFCSGPVYFCLRIVTAQNKYFYGNQKITSPIPHHITTVQSLFSSLSSSHKTQPPSIPKHLPWDVSVPLQRLFLLVLFCFVCLVLFPNPLSLQVCLLV